LPFFVLTNRNVKGCGNCCCVSRHRDASARAAAREYGLKGSNAVGGLLEVTVTVEAANNCSSADWGRRILSPGNAFLLLGATLKTADQDREISGTAIVTAS
jgi:hypothetical protein